MMGDRIDATKHRYVRRNDIGDRHRRCLSRDTFLAAEWLASGCSVAGFFSLFREFVEQGVVQPDFQPVALVRIELVRQDFPATRDRCVERVHLQAAVTGNTLSMHEKAAIHKVFISALA